MSEIDYEAISDAEERERQFLDREAGNAEDAAAKAKVIARSWERLRDEVGPVAGPRQNINVEASVRDFRSRANAARARADTLHALARKSPGVFAARVVASIRAEAQGQEAEHIEWRLRADNPEAFIDSVEHLRNLDPSDQADSFRWEEASRRHMVLAQREVIDEYEALAEPDAPSEP